MEPEDSLNMGDEHLSTIPEKESDEVIKASVEDLVLIPSESKDTSDNDSECNLPFCDDSFPLDILGANSMTFSNPLFDSNDDFTSSDDESLPEEDVQEENFKIYLNPLFEFDKEYIFSNVNPLFNEVLEDIENKDSYVSNLDEPALLVTPLFDANEDEYFDSGGDIDEINSFLDIDVSTDIEGDYYNSKGDIIYLKSILRIMPPRMRTRSTGRPVAESRGGGTGKRVGRGRRGRGPRGGNDECVDESNGQGNNQGAGANRNVEGVNGAQVCNQGNVGSQMGNVVNEKIPENVRNILVNSNQEGCSYKEFLAYNPKEYDGKGGVVFKMIEEFRPSHEMQKLETKLWNHIMVRAGHAAYTDRFHELARLVPHLISGALTDEAVRNGSIKKVEKRGNVGEPSKDKNGRDDNKRTRTRNAFSTTTNLIGRENMGA
ncbi:hypothetical protein Tco_0024096 [Tanacetum coccineum]